MFSRPCSPGIFWLQNQRDWLVGPKWRMYVSINYVFISSDNGWCHYIIRTFISLNMLLIAIWKHVAVKFHKKGEYLISRKISLFIYFLQDSGHGVPVPVYDEGRVTHTIYPKKYAHGFCFAVLCCGYTLTDFPISIRLTSLALWQSNDCPSASKATLMNMDKYFMWIQYERLHNHNKAKHNKTVCIFLGIYCRWVCEHWFR